MFSFFKKKSKKDELIGRWETTNEGGFQMLGGSRLVLNENGSGTSVSWGYGADEPFEFKNEIVWERVGDKMIRIKNAEDEHFTTVTYSIEPYTGAYNFKYDKLYEPGNHLEKHGLKGIWNIPGELFRRKK